MTFGNADSNLPEPDASRERLELETRVLAAALRQSLERGDTEGSSQAHQQIFVLLKASQDMGWEEPITLPPDLPAFAPEKKRTLPDIDWGVPDESPIISADVASEVGPEAFEITSEHPVMTDLAEVTSEGKLEVSVGIEPVHNFDELPTIHPQLLDSVTGDGLPGLPEAAELIGPELDIAAVQIEVTVAVNSALEDTEVSGNHSLSGYIPLALVPGALAAAVGAAVKSQSISDYYTHLEVSQTADFNTIHKQFLRKVRPLLRRQFNEQLTGVPRKELLATLQALWIAHDILCDAVTRTDYDFRRMGLRGHEVSDPAKPGLSIRPQLRIGELLQCAGLLETTELEIAADMHKAMPELMFGAFLVKQGFIADEDLDCVLLGQQLLKTGGITVAQFQDAMTERATAGGDVGDILVARNYLNREQLQEAYRSQMDETVQRIPIVSATVSLRDSEIDVAETLNSPDEEESAEPEEYEESVDNHLQAQTGEQLSVYVPADIVEVSHNVSVDVSVDGSVEVNTELGGETEAPTALEQNQGHNEEPAFEPQLIAPDFVAAIFSQDLPPREVPSESDVPVSPASPVAPVRTLNIVNAVPSWKDQLDWSSPDVSSPEASSSDLSSLSVEEPQSSETSGTVQNQSEQSVSMDSPAPNPADSQRKPKHSLLDLMVGLETTEPKRNEVEQSSSLMSHILQGNATTGDASVPTTAPATAPATAQPAVDDFAPPVIEDGDETAAFADEFAALDAAAAEALDIEEHSAIEAAGWGEAAPANAIASQASDQASEPASDPAANPNFVQPPASSAPQAANSVPPFAIPQRPPVSSQVSPQANSQINKDIARDQAMSAEMQKDSGSWQIVSIPASALASLLLDDEPEDETYQPGSHEGKVNDDAAANQNPPYGSSEKRNKRRRTKS